MELLQVRNLLPVPPGLALVPEPELPGLVLLLLVLELVLPLLVPVPVLLLLVPVLP